MKKLIAFIFIVFNAFVLSAQKNLDKMDFDIYHLYKGYISENNSIQGYYDFYSIGEDATIFNSQGQKVGIAKKIINWGIDISDENGNLINRFQFQEMKCIRLLESAYSNGEICFEFANYKEKTLNYKIFNVEGKKLLDYSYELDKSEWNKLERYNMMNEAESGNNSDLFSIEGGGFFAIIPCEIGKNNSFKVLKFKSQETQKVQTFAYDAVSKMNFAYFMGLKGNIAYLKIQRSNGIFLKDILVNILAIDLNSMKKVFETKGEDLGEFIFDPTSLVEDKKYRTIKLIGKYFKNEDNLLKDESQGLALWELSPNGTLLREKYRNWSKDFNGFLKFNQNGKSPDFGFAFIHKTFQLSNGQIVAIAEGYRKQADAGGIAMGVMGAALGGGISSGGYSKLQVTDMAVIKFDDNFNFINGDVYKKAKNDINLGAADFSSAHVGAFMVKKFGGFDYNYTQINDNQTEFIVFYTDCIKKNFLKENDYKHFFLRYSTEGIVKDEMPVKQDKKIIRRLYANQFQKILQWEYHKKERKIENKVVKLK